MFLEKNDIDIAQGIKILLREPAIGGNICNLGEDIPVTIQEILHLVHENVELVDPVKPLDNPWNGIISTEKIRRLGFRPLVSSLYSALDMNFL